MCAMQRSDQMGTMHTLTKLDRDLTECRVPSFGRWSSAAGLHLTTQHCNSISMLQD